MSHKNFLCELTIIIPRHPYLVTLGKAVSLTVELVNYKTSDSVNLFNLAMCTFPSKCDLIELVPCSDGWRRTCIHTIHMMHVLPVRTILECK